MLIQLGKLKCPYCGSDDVSEDCHEEMWCDPQYLIPRIYWVWECYDCDKKFHMIIHIEDYDIEKIEE